MFVNGTLSSWDDLGTFNSFKPLNELYKVTNGFFRLKIEGYKSLYEFKSIRFYCYNPSSKRVVHVMSSDTDNGKYLVDWLRFVTNKRKIVGDNARCKDALVRLHDDNSTLSQECNNIGEDLYTHPFFSIQRVYGTVISGPTSEIKVNPPTTNTIACDDIKLRTPEGIWQYFVW